MPSPNCYSGPPQYDIMKRGDQWEAFFGDGQSKVSGLESATPERNPQVQSEAQGRLAT